LPEEKQGNLYKLSVHLDDNGVLNHATLPKLGNMSYYGGGKLGTSSMLQKHRSNGINLQKTVLFTV